MGSILINRSVPLILWDWQILLFMKLRGLLDCHPEMRILKQFDIKRVLQWNGIRVQLFFFPGDQILLESSDVFGSRAMYHGYVPSSFEI